MLDESLGDSMSRKSTGSTRNDPRNNAHATGTKKKLDGNSMIVMDYELPVPGCHSRFQFFEKGLDLFWFDGQKGNIFVVTGDNRTIHKYDRSMRLLDTTITESWAITI